VNKKCPGRGGAAGAVAYARERSLIPSLPVCRRRWYMISVNDAMRRAGLAPAPGPQCNAGHFPHHWALLTVVVLTSGRPTDTNDGIYLQIAQRPASLPSYTWWQDSNLRPRALPTELHHAPRLSRCHRCRPLLTACNRLHPERVGPALQSRPCITRPLWTS
jgi:hypothetical protein